MSDREKSIRRFRFNEALEEDIIEKDKTIQLLANALKDIADLLGKQPTYMGSRDEKYRELADKYLNAK